MKRRFRRWLLRHIIRAEIREMTAAFKQIAVLAEAAERERMDLEGAC